MLRLLHIWRGAIWTIAYFSGGFEFVALRWPLDVWSYFKVSYDIWNVKFDIIVGECALLYIWTCDCSYLLGTVWWPLLLFSSFKNRDWMTSPPNIAPISTKPDSRRQIKTPTNPHNSKWGYLSGRLKENRKDSGDFSRRPKSCGQKLRWKYSFWSSWLLLVLSFPTLLPHAPLLIESL